MKSLGFFRALLVTTSVLRIKINLLLSVPLLVFTTQTMAFDTITFQCRDTIYRIKESVIEKDLKNQTMERIPYRGIFEKEDGHVVSFREITFLGGNEAEERFINVGGQVVHRLTWKSCDDTGRPCHRETPCRQIL